MLTLRPGGGRVERGALKLNLLRNDVIFYPVPFDKLVAPVCPDAKLRRLVRNMIYDGVLAKLLGIDLALMEKALAKQLGKRRPRPSPSTPARSRPASTTPRPPSRSRTRSRSSR